MNSAKLLQRVVGVTLILMFVTGCSFLTPSTAKPGYWKGENTSFFITEQGTIKNFKITVDGCQVNIKDEIVIVKIDAPGSFVINPEGALTGSFADSSVTDFSANAKFDNATSLTGTYKWKICGNMENLSGPVEGSWAAEWTQ